jgi:hypothetical protein
MIFIFFNPSNKTVFFVYAHCIGCAFIYFTDSFNKTGIKKDGFILFSEKEIKHFDKYSFLEYRLKEFKSSLTFHLN